MSVDTKSTTLMKTGARGFLLGPRVRKLVLTAHLVSSIGWLGAVAGFAALDISALNDRNAQVVSAAYLSMALITRFVIVPLAIAALLTGLIQALGTPWGLFRYYWVLAKLGLTLLATVVLLQKVALINYAASQASKPQLSGVALQALGRPLALHSVGGLLVLFVITTVSVYKPWGLTAYGKRILREQGFVPTLGSARATWRWVYVAGIFLLLLLVGMQHFHHLSGALLEHHRH